MRLSLISMFLFGCTGAAIGLSQASWEAPLPRVEPQEASSGRLGSSRVARLESWEGWRAAEGTTTGVFKVHSVTVFEQGSHLRVKKLQNGIEYDLVAIVEVPYGDTFPWTWQIEYGKAAFLGFAQENGVFASAGVYSIETTVTLDLDGSWGIAIALGGNRTKTAKVKVF